MHDSPMKKIAICFALAIGVVGGVGISACSDYGGGCCKECQNGKPCGDSCISNSTTCNQPPGCACYADGEDSGSDSEG
jgi:hypothetical protein